MEQEKKKEVKKENKKGKQNEAKKRGHPSERDLLLVFWSQQYR